MTYFGSDITSHETDISLRRNKPLRGVLSLRSSRSTPNATNKKALTRRAFLFIRSLTMTYFHIRDVHYHRRKVVSLSCSGWEGVGPTRYGRQT